MVPGDVAEVIGHGAAHVLLGVVAQGSSSGRTGEGSRCSATSRAPQGSRGRLPSEASRRRCTSGLRDQASSRASGAPGARDERPHGELRGGVPGQHREGVEGGLGLLEPGLLDPRGPATRPTPSARPVPPPGTPRARPGERPGSAQPSARATCATRAFSSSSSSPAGAARRRPRRRARSRPAGRGRSARPRRVELVLEAPGASSVACRRLLLVAFDVSAPRRLASSGSSPALRRACRWRSRSHQRSSSTPSPSKRSCSCGAQALVVAAAALELVLLRHQALDVAADRVVVHGAPLRVAAARRRPRRRSTSTTSRRALTDCMTGWSVARACPLACRFGELSQQRRARRSGIPAGAASVRRWRGSPRSPEPARGRSTSIWSRCVHVVAIVLLRCAPAAPAQVAVVKPPGPPTGRRRRGASRERRRTRGGEALSESDEHEGAVLRYHRRGGRRPARPALSLARARAALQSSSHRPFVRPGPAPPRRARRTGCPSSGVGAPRTGPPAGFGRAARSRAVHVGHRAVRIAGADDAGDRAGSPRPRGRRGSRCRPSARGRSARLRRRGRAAPPTRWSIPLALDRVGLHDRALLGVELARAC